MKDQEKEEGIVKSVRQSKRRKRQSYRSIIVEEAS